MTITWESVIGLSALATAIVAALLWVIRQMVQSALLEFEHRFFERLNGRYIKSELCKERHRDLMRRVEAVEREASA